MQPGLVCFVQAKRVLQASLLLVVEKRKGLHGHDVVEGSECFVCVGGTCQHKDSEQSY